jgi:hypothetical protein
MNGAAREAFRTGDLNGIVIRRQGVRIHHAHADEENKYFPCADCDPHGQGTRRDMCRFLVAFGTMVTIGLVCTHNDFLPDQNGTVFYKALPPMKFYHSKS